MGSGSINSPCRDHPMDRAAIYICVTQIQWQRDCSENINVPIRQHPPEGIDFLGLNQEQLDALPCN